jgi:hypothetical protein
MYRAPFHRQILPWLYVAIFLVVAPLLIFYTSGYRWNQKKGQIERNGTLIVDASPRGANVYLDDASTGERTPITLQNIAPGWHRIRIESDGFYPWEKTLEVRAEQVTFANNVWLWRKESPTLVLAVTSTGIWSNPAQDGFVYGTYVSNTFALRYWPDTQRAQTNLPTLATGTIPTIRWRSDGGALLINGQTTQETGWWAITGQSKMEPLPHGAYQWDGNDIRGLDGTSLLFIKTNTRALVREPLATGDVDQLGSLALTQNTTTHALTLEDRSLLRQTFSLPNGSWRFAGTQASFTLLRDGQRWVAIRPRFGEPYAGMVAGDEPEWLDGVPDPIGLIINQNELWIWRLGEDARLLWRQSEPIIEAHWHRSGTTVFLATQRSIMAISLDDSSGRQTATLAEFDRVDGFDLLDRDLFVSGERAGVRGLWRLRIE